MHKSLDEFEFHPDPTTAELPALERLQKSIYNVVNTLAHSFLI